jgi:hypothetical protein
MIMTTKRRNMIGLVLLWSVFMAILLFYGASNINNLFYQRGPLIGDTASYWLRDLSILDVKPYGHWLQQVLNTASQNSRDPLHTLSLAVVGPDKGLSVNGHLYLSAFAAFFFFASLVACLLIRTRLPLYAFSAPWAMLLALCFWDPVRGLPSHLPDMPAAFFFGASLLTLFIRRDGGNNALTFVSGAFLGLATLSRYHIWMYGTLVIAPVVSIFAVDRFLKTRMSIKELLFPYFSFVAGLGLVAGYFIVHWATEVIFFYSVAGYGLNQTVSAAISTTGKKLIVYTMGLPALSALVFLALGYFSILWKGRRQRDIGDHVAVLWAGFSCIVLVLLVLKVEDDVTQTYYMIPGLLLMSMAPFRVLPRLMPIDLQSAISRFAFGLAFLLPSIAIASYVAQANSEALRYPREQFQDINKFNTNLAELVVAALPSKSPAAPVLDSNFDYYARFVIPTAQLRFKRHARFGNVFQIRQSQWELRRGLPKDGSRGARFTGILEEDRELIMPALVKSVDVLMVLTDVDNPRASDLTKDVYTRELARYVTAQVASDPETWEPRGRLSSPYSSDVIVYLNKRLQSSPAN